MAIQERVGMPLDEFIEQGNEHPFEIINGERIPKLPNVAGHSYLIRLLDRLLSAESHVGEVFSETTYTLPNQFDSDWVTGSRIPDLMFIVTDRWTAYIETNPDWKQKPLMIVPDLVIEVVSPTDRYTKVNEKVDAYLSDGVRLIVIIDPFTYKAIIHAPDAEQPLHLSGDAQLDLSDVIPDLKIALPSLFE